MNKNMKFKDLSVQERIRFNGGSETGVRTFWQDISYAAGYTIRYTLLCIEAFMGGASVVSGVK
jgi:hypothetical protein